MERGYFSKFNIYSFFSTQNLLRVEFIRMHVFLQILLAIMTPSDKDHNTICNVTLWAC